VDIGWVLVERTKPALVQHWIDHYLYSRTVAAMKEPNLRDIGPALAYDHGLLSEIGRNHRTEILDLYRPLYEKVRNKDAVWFGLNLIWPGQEGLNLPLVPGIQCYVITFHGDPIDAEWLTAQLQQMKTYWPRFDLKNIILVSNAVSSSQFPDITVHRLDHLHLLRKWYGNPDIHMFRSADVRRHKWGFASYRSSWPRTALATCIIDKPDGIFSVAHIPDYLDNSLLDFITTHRLSKSFEKLQRSIPCPMDDYYQSPTDLSHAWSVNNLLYQDCVINVVVESSPYYGEGFMTEKSFKPLISGSLPLFNDKRWVQRLREFGFQIEDHYYDDHHDPIIRQSNTLDKLLRMPTNDLINLASENAEHNRSWFFDGFYETVSSSNHKKMEELIAMVKKIVD